MLFFFFNDTATTEIYTLSLHDALPICEDTVTSLRIRDLESGDERWLRHDVQRDDMESRFSRDLMPNMAVTPDSKALITTWGGKLWRVALPTGEATPIPFRAEVDQQLGALSKFTYPINDSTL